MGMGFISFFSCFGFRMLFRFRLYFKCAKNGLNPPFPLTQPFETEFSDFIKEHSKIEKYYWLKNWVLLDKILLILIGCSFFLVLIPIDEMIF